MHISFRVFHISGHWPGVTAIDSKFIFNVLLSSVMFSISLIYFIVANSRDRSLESTFRPWNTEVFDFDARERETDWIQSKTQQLSIYQKKKRYEYILSNKERDGTVGRVLDC